MVVSVGYLTLLLRPYCVLSSFTHIFFLATLLRRCWYLRGLFFLPFLPPSKLYDASTINALSYVAYLHNIP